MPRKKAPEPRWPPLPRRKPGTGSIQRLADGSLRARLPRRIDPKRQAREFPPDQLDTALAWLAAHLRHAAGAPASPVHSGATSLGDWTGYWYETFVVPIRPPNTQKTYLYALRQLEQLYGVTLADLRTSQLQAEIGRLAQRVAGANVANVVGVWRRCLEAAVDDDLIAKNPARKLVVPEAPKTTAPRRHVTAAEVALLWPAMRGHRFEAAYALVLGCGLRIGEVLGLYWKHVDLSRRRIWVADQFTNGHWRPLPKGKNPHWIRLPDPVAAILQRHRASQPADAVLVMQSPHRGQRSKGHTKPMPWSRNTVAVDLAALVERLKLDPLTPHAGRHGLSSYLLNEGLPAAEVAALLGHSSPAITLRAYSHPVGDPKLLDAALGKYLGEPSGATLAAVQGAETDD